MVKQSSLINLNCSYTGIVNKQPNKFYNSKNQMNKELLLDNSVFALFYSLKDAIFSLTVRIFPQFHINFINLKCIPTKQINNQTNRNPTV